MSIRTINFAIDEYYHLYNRGNAKRIIFKDSNDYRRFERLLFVCNSNKAINFRELSDDFEREAPLVAIGAYCLMSNHFHLLVREIGKDGITKFMQKLSTSYAMYFNKKYAMSGSLFEGKFKAQHIDADRQLRYLYCYIHLNPLEMIEPLWKENGIKNKTTCFDFLSHYEHSSYLFFESIDSRTNKKFLLLSPDSFPNYFSRALQHKQELLNWIKQIP